MTKQGICALWSGWFLYNIVTRGGIDNAKINDNLRHRFASEAYDLYRNVVHFGIEFLRKQTRYPFDGDIIQTFINSKEFTDNTYKIIDLINDYINNPSKYGQPSFVPNAVIRPQPEKQTSPKRKSTPRRKSTPKRKSPTRTGRSSSSSSSSGRCPNGSRRNRATGRCVKY